MFDDYDDYEELPTEPENLQPPEPRSIFMWTSFVGLVSAIIFVGFPQIDLWVGELFLIGKRTFIFNVSEAGPIVRNLFLTMFVLASLAALAGLAFSILSSNRLFGLTFPKWLFVTAALLIGPGLIANIIFKENWGRARPLYIEQFGGDQKFTPVLIRSDQCKANCSFVSGEASSIYAVFFIFALLLLPKRRQLIKWGIAAGTLAGIVRMAQGGHFLSDVVFAGVFMMLAVLALHWLIFTRYAATLKDNGWVHASLALAAMRADRKTRRFIRSKGWDKIIRRPDDESSR